MNKWIYEFLYRFPFVPIEWIFGRHLILEQMIEGGHIKPGRAIDIGCGEGSNGAIFMAKSGFQVTGVDFSPTAIRRARKNAQAANVEATFVEDDLTNLKHVEGTFDLMVDIGAFNDLNSDDRIKYIENVTPLAHSGTFYLLGCFKRKLGPEEIERHFGRKFKIVPLPVDVDSTAVAAGFNYHLMTRK